MVSINIGAGQGVTQAIASKLGLSKDDLKKINLSTWQNVMTEVSNAQSQIDKHNASNNGDKQKSIFTGGRDVQIINQQSRKDNQHIAAVRLFEQVDQTVLRNKEVDDQINRDCHNSEIKYQLSADSEFFLFQINLLLCVKSCYSIVVGIKCHNCGIWAE